MKKKNRFECPKAIVIRINDDDIILTSGPGGGTSEEGDDWEWDND